GADDGDLARGAAQQLTGGLLQAGGAEHQRHASFDAAANVGVGGRGEREVDDDAVATRPQLVDDGEADVVETGEATGVLAEPGAALAIDGGLEDHPVAEDDLADEGLAHAAAGADDDNGDEAFGRHDGSKSRVRR